MIDNRSLHQVSQRLSLRKPQTESLQLLAEILDLAEPLVIGDGPGFALAVIGPL